MPSDASKKNILKSVWQNVTGDGETEIVHHFKNLFDFTDNENITDAMNQVFLFVHEVKGFLKKAKLILKVPEATSLSGILLKIKESLSKSHH